MDVLHSSSYFQVPQSLYQSFGDCTKSTNYNWYHHHFHIPQFFNSRARSRYLSFFAFSFNFILWSAGTEKATIRQVLFFCWLLIGLVIWSRLGEPFVSQNPREVCAFHSPGQLPGCVYTICSYGQISISCTIPRGSRCPPSHVQSYTHLVLVCCIHFYVMDNFVSIMT